MPIRSPDPFADPTVGLRPEVNPFLSRMVEAQLDGSLPVVFGPKLKEFSGAWRSRFAERAEDGQAPRALVVEVGSHKGDVLNRMAADHRETGFVGIDITFKRVVTTANKAVAAGHQNVLSVLANASQLDRLFAPGELSGLVIFFPDPWIKKRSQTKNRLVGPDFLARAFACIAPGGFFWLKTDAKDYFDESAVALAEAGFVPAPPAYQGLPTETYTSRFERHFIEQGLPTYAGIWLKPGH